MDTLFIVDGHGRLRATVTDGDVRRALLDGYGLDSPAETVFNTEFVKQVEGSESSQRGELGFDADLKNIPVVDSEGRLLCIDLVLGRPDSVRRSNVVVIMAGGKGLRLRPLTEQTPKPLLLVRGKPILEHIIENLRDEGFVNIVIAINYLGGQIENHFQDGSRLGVNIRYLREERELGTAGALSLLGETDSSPIVVMNGDLVLAASVGRMLDYHLERDSVITVGAKVVETPIPYGVLTTNGTIIQGIEEKPSHIDLVNAGVYVLNTEVFASLAPDQVTDMPQLILENVEGGRVLAYPIHEKWADLGSPNDLKKAQGQR